MVWGCLTNYGVEALALVDGNMNSQKYTSVLENNVLPLIPKPSFDIRFKMKMPLRRV